MKKASPLIEKVHSLYREVDRKIAKAGNLSGTCEACGKCCNFESFGHKLFVSTPELISFKDKLAAEKLKTMETGVCPYNAKGECTVHKERFLGCRIFCCKGDEQFQSALTEFALKKIRSICEEEKVPYRYMDLSRGLNFRF